MKVEIKDKIIKRLQKRVKETDEFNNVEEYIDYILKQVAERLDNEKETEGEPEDSEEVYSKEDEEKVKERLKSLGYLD
ncbi:CopG family transcriptional regulator [Candidatus Woesearchaeota archaeon]|nr:CopG family transcriptional regulator [Candidatus Woesearchaeota archaeon]